MVYAVCPNLPYEKNFKCEIKPGFQLLVTGHILEDYFRGIETPAIRGFAINLNGNHSSDSDRILHFNPRFDQSVVVLNSHRGQWGPEERPHQYPFNTQHDFSIVFQAHSDEFKIFVNGNHFHDYKYREPLSAITGLTIRGQVIIHQVITSKHEVDNFPPPIAPRHEPITFHPELPLTLNKPIEANTHIGIPGNLQPGMVFAFIGKSPEDADRFSINWLTHSGDVAFHFNPRFEADVVVRNTKTGGHWGAEEREHQSPFKRDTKFQIFVKVHASHYAVWVNGSHFCDFHHRIHPLSEVKAIEFVGNVKIKLAKITF